MLRKRSRSKQALMADLTKKQTKLTPFPRLFTAFSSFKSFTENDAVASPTSILDTKPFSVLKNKNPFGSDNPKTQEPETRLKLESKRIGLAILDSLLQEDTHKHNLSKTVLFGSQLRIRIPDFAINTENSSKSPLETKKPDTGSDTRSDPGSSNGSPKVLKSFFSASDMELSEDYTCVTSHGPNPRTIHIFDNYIVESQPGVVFFRSSEFDTTSFNERDYFSPDSFLSICCYCKKNLGPSDDIFMYRGDRAFCSSECRSLEMMSEEDNMI